MPDDPNIVPTIRLVRWIAVGLIVVFAIVLYFREGRYLPPITTVPVGASADSAR